MFDALASESAGQPFERARPAHLCLSRDSLSLSLSLSTPPYSLLLCSSYQFSPLLLCLTHCCFYFFSCTCPFSPWLLSCISLFVPLAGVLLFLARPCGNPDRVTMKLLCSWGGCKGHLSGTRRIHNASPSCLFGYAAMEVGGWGGGGIDCQGRAACTAMMEIAFACFL